MDGPELTKELQLIKASRQYVKRDLKLSAALYSRALKKADRQLAQLADHEMKLKATCKN